MPARRSSTGTARIAPRSGRVAERIFDRRQKLRAGSGSVHEPVDRNEAVDRRQASCGNLLDGDEHRRDGWEGEAASGLPGADHAHDRARRVPQLRHRLLDPDLGADRASRLQQPCSTPGRRRIPSSVVLKRPAAAAVPVSTRRPAAPARLDVPRILPGTQVEQNPRGRGSVRALGAAVSLHDRSGPPLDQVGSVVVPCVRRDDVQAVSTDALLGRSAGPDDLAWPTAPGARYRRVHLIARGGAACRRIDRRRWTGA